MSELAMEKPTFTTDQLISAATASKQFGQLRKKAQSLPMFITDNGSVETVVMGYKYFEQMYQRLLELEELNRDLIVLQRVKELDQDPSIAIPWEEIRRTGVKK